SINLSIGKRSVGVKRKLSNDCCLCCTKDGFYCRNGRTSRFTLFLTRDAEVVRIYSTVLSSFKMWKGNGIKQSLFTRRLNGPFCCYETPCFIKEQSNRFSTDLLGASAVCAYRNAWVVYNDEYKCDILIFINI
ncbi:hypothetical protein Tcan_01818, partial [Toxocara canis]